MTGLGRLLALGALVLAGCGTNAATAENDIAATAKLSLPLYEEAVTIKRPVLPARMMDGDCPVVDQCEFGTEWRTCQAIPLHRDAADGAPVLRQLKAMETFVAEGGEIELIAPGKIAITDVTYPDQTGGRSMDPGATLEVYGPLHDSKALYFDPATGRAFSPPANSDHWWWDGKNARMTAVPKMNWWVRARTKDKAVGWIKLRSREDADGFPNYAHDEILEAWDIHRTRDDETPDCGEMLEQFEKDRSSG